MPLFGVYVTTLLAKRGLSQTNFATRVGMSQSHIAHVLRGQSPLAIRHIDTWADALELTGAGRRRFRMEALLTRCPVEIRDYVHATMSKPRRRPRIPPKS